MDDRSGFGSWLKAQRKALHLTQRDLAQLAGYSLETVKKIEEGKRQPSQRAARAFMELLGVSSEQQQLGVRALADATFPGDLSKRTLSLDDDSSRLETHRLDTTGSQYSGTGYATNLPAQSNSFVGRAVLMGALKSLLQQPDVRILTLIGPPGVGKTRMSLELASAVQDDFPDGVWLVPLASVRASDLVAPAIASALGIRVPFRGRELPGGHEPEFTEQAAISGVTSPHSDPERREPGRIVDRHSLAQWLRSKHLLLLLDNFEQVLSAAPLISELLAVASKLKVLVTSRVALNLYGEHIKVLPPLTLPDTACLSRFECLHNNEAIRLFTERASAKSGFALNPDNAQEIAQLCARLDGIPLAIELAAARARFITPREMLSRFDKRFLSDSGPERSEGMLDLVTDGPQDRPPRQQTLRSAIEWSYDLLGPQEQKLFRRLGVFAGGFSLDAAAEVCFGIGSDLNGAQPISPRAEKHIRSKVLGEIESLLDRSLLRVRETRNEEIAPGFAYSMLETIREYAHEQLEKSDEIDAVQRLHATYYMAIAEVAQRQPAGTSQKSWLDLLETEQDNMRVALDWCEVANTQESLQIGVRIVSAIWWYWEVRGHFTEGRRQLSRAVSWCARCRQPGREASILWVAGRLASFQGDNEEAKRLLNRSLELYQEVGYKQGIGFALVALGNVALASCDYSAARSRYEEALSIRRALGWPREVSMCLSALAGVASVQGDNISASAMVAEALELGRTVGNDHVLQGILLDAANIALRGGEWLRAKELLEEGWSVAYGIDFKVGLMECLLAFGQLAAAQGRYSAAAELFGSSAAQFEAIHACMNPTIRLEYDRHMTAAHVALGDALFEEHWAVGLRLTLEEAHRVAMQEIKLDSTLSGHGPSLLETVILDKYSTSLTNRERGVLSAVAMGLTNTQIAAHLSLSRHTVNAHLRSIYNKLGVATRSAATRCAIERNLVKLEVRD